MPRKARQKSKSGIYHIILRGQNRQTIFVDDQDKEKFLHTLKRYKDKSEYKIYAYCLMGNHIHILIHELKEDIGTIMRRIGASYVYWYNFKYNRCGHLFQDRYRSEAVENDEYFLTVLRYIHNNPKKAGIVKNILEYKWSSYNDYLNNEGITETDFTLEIINNDKRKAIEGFIKFHNEQNEDKCLEIEENFRLKDGEAKEIIKRECEIENTFDLKYFDKDKRKECIKLLKNKGLSSRQIERLTGINKSIILKS